MKHEKSHNNGTKPGAQTSAQNADLASADEAVVSEATAAASTGEAVQAATDGSELPSEPTPEQVITQIQAELDAERARFAELYDRYQRSAAEYQNSRRRQEKQTTEAIERASSHVIRKLLPVMDDLDLAFRNIPAGLGDDLPAWVDGFRQIQRKLQGVLEEEGVAAMPVEGEFDPSQHEAVSSEPNDSVPSGHIISTLRVGYTQHGQVLRPALVRVAA